MEHHHLIIWTHLTYRWQGKQQQQQQQQARLSPGQTAHDLRKAETSNHPIPPNPCINPPCPRLRLSRGEETLTNHQQPGMNLFILSPPARKVLPVRRQTRPLPFPPVRSPALNWPESLQRGHCNPSHASPSRFWKTHFQRAKIIVSREGPLVVA